MRINPQLLCLALAIFLSGCTKISHIDQLLTLQAYSKDKNAQQRYVEQQDRNFEKILAAVKDQSLSQYPGAQEILKSFGNPVFTRKVDQNGSSTEQWLYRYATRYFNSHKVYLYFDEKGKLLRWELIAPESSGQGGIS